MPKPQKPRLETFKKYFKPKASIQEIVREPTAGGIVFRHGEKDIEILLIQDAKDRWTIPKGHIEEGETAVQTARREIGEEAGLTDKLWVIGGNLPAQDHDALRALGFKGIFPSGSKLDAITEYIRSEGK